MRLESSGRSYAPEVPRAEILNTLQVLRTCAVNSVSRAAGFIHLAFVFAAAFKPVAPNSN